MRRLIVPLSLLAATAGATWLLAMAAPAGAAQSQGASQSQGAAQSQPGIACPASTSLIISCCPLMPPEVHSGGPQPICCGEMLCCAGGLQPNDCCAPGGSSTCPTSSLTIGSVPDPSTAGQKVVISGTVTANPTAGGLVSLWRKLSWQSSFHQFAQATTDSSGGYTFTMPRGTVMADQQWYVTSGSLQSPTIAQRVRALVGLAPSAHSAAAGRPILLRGSVTPSHAGEVVLIEQSVGGTWHVIARPRLQRASSYTISHRFGQSGTMKLRTVFRGDARNVWSASPTVTLPVMR